MERQTAHHAVAGLMLVGVLQAAGLQEACQGEGGAGKKQGKRGAGRKQRVESELGSLVW